ncbi:MAG TPA: chorismate mutase [Gaiellaceae bacterium]|jgi:chorismate mutase|nr:chorismate mutase [Gaiellaceae bacterium]
MTDATLTDAREAIDQVDRELLDAFNRRLDLVRNLHRHKVETGLPLRDPGREEGMIESLKDANGGSLSPAGVESFFGHILELTRSELHGE